MIDFYNVDLAFYSGSKPGWGNPNLIGRFSVKEGSISYSNEGDRIRLFDIFPEGKISARTYWQLEKYWARNHMTCWLEKDRVIHIAIGDIHGCLSALELLIKNIESKYDLESVKLVFLGDYVDRGKQGRKVLDYLMGLAHEYPHFVFLVGNHEFELLNGRPCCLDTDESVLSEYTEYKMSQRHFNFLDWKSFYYISQNFAFVHGGVPTGFDRVNHVPENKLVWQYGVWSGYTGKKVICGHSARGEVVETANSICIDTGCCYQHWGHLTAVVLNDREGDVLEYIRVKNPDF
jgi:serine/threonine protein phosphatase 1